MSRIGLLPIELPSGVDVTIAGRKVTVKGKGGTLEQELPPGIEAVKEQNRVLVQRRAEDKRTRAFHGLARALISNHVKGVSEGYRKELEIRGVSYQASVSGRSLVLKLGYANDVSLAIPAGVEVNCPNPTLIVVMGADKQKVGQFAAEVRTARPPEPYKGKGVRYRGEHIHRKQGKSFVGAE
ncbi:MAG: 50S ribosomal protein L6 [Planctomycetota bacterium]|jgi:large subunit ribosomal protein L6